MARICELTGVGVQFGNNVSHSQRKTRRRFEPNIQTIKYNSQLTGQSYRLKITASCIRMIEKAGGLDDFMIGTAYKKVAKMSLKAKGIYNKIIKYHLNSLKGNGIQGNDIREAVPKMQ